MTSSTYNEGTYRYTGHERDYDLELDYMINRHYSWKYGRFYQTDPVNGSVGSSQSWNLYTYVQNNPMNYTDPYGLLREGEGGGIISSTSDNPDPVLECTKRGAGCEYKFGKCICGGCEVDLNTNVYNCGFGESVSIIGPSVWGTINEEDIKKYLPDRFFEEFNLIPFEVWAAQYSMHGGPWVFAPNYRNPAVQIMGQVSQNVQPWLEYGTSLWDIYMLASGIGHPAGNITFKFIKGPGLELKGKSIADRGFRLVFHGKHHEFRLLGKVHHFQINTWLERIKGSGQSFRIPLFW